MFLLFQPQVNYLPVPVKVVVDEPISPELPGRVSFEGSHWPARFYDEAYAARVLAGKNVWVVGVEGITVLVFLDYSQALICLSSVRYVS